MDRVEFKDTLIILKEYLTLMWCVHSNIEGTTLEELSTYRLGIQTFLLKLQNEVDKALEQASSK